MERKCRCGQTEIPAGASFCPSCGKRLNGEGKQKVAFLALPLTLLVAIPLWYFQPEIIGKRPEKKFNPQAHATQFQYQDPDLERLRSAARNTPDNKQNWLALAEGLIEKSQAGIIERSVALRDTLEAVTKAVEIDPEDSRAVYLAAEVNFEAQKFSEARTFYERYLVFHPDDKQVMTRYASALTFAGAPERAIEILEQLIAEEPHNFQARAILAIAYSQTGERERALEVGEEALPFAPNDQARERFQQFLSGVEQGMGMSPTENASSEGGNPQAIQLAQFIKENPVAGPKIVDFRVQGDVLTVITQDFPMSAMPPFAKEKFYSGIKNFANENGIDSIAEVQFLEQGAAAPQASVPLASGE